MDHAATMRRLYELLSAGDVDGFGDSLADDFIDHEELPGLSPTKEGVKTFFHMYLAAFPDLRMDAEDVLSSGDKVVARVRARGTHQGELMGMPATGKADRRAAHRHHPLRRRWARGRALGRLRHDDDDAAARRHAGRPAGLTDARAAAWAALAALRRRPVTMPPWLGDDMRDPGRIEIRRLDPAEIERHLDALAAVLQDVVSGGASIGYMAPFSHEDARDAFKRSRRRWPMGAVCSLPDFSTAISSARCRSFSHAPPNQPHRGEITKLLVHRPGRRRGVAQQLMERAEAEALAEGKTLLVLDTADDTAERLYSRLGWTLVGVIPGFALFPDGRPCATTVLYKTLAP